MKLDFRPIFVVNAPRSGSTLFRLILNSHPEICAPTPSWLYEIFAPFLYSYGDLSKKENLKVLAEEIAECPTMKRGNLTVTAAELLDATEEASFRGLFAAMHNIVAARYGKKRWAQKSPRYAFWVREILRDFPDAQIVHLVRDGRDVTLDLSEATNFRPDNLLSSAGVWARYVEAAHLSTQGLSKEQFYQVRYEDICAAPEEECRKLAAFLGVEYSPNMLNHHTSEDTKKWAADPTHAKTARPITTDYCYMWKKRLKGNDLNVITSEMRPQLEKFGYDISQPHAELDLLDRLQMLENEVPTQMGNHGYKVELHKARKARLEAGIWSEADRKSLLWGVF